MPEIQAPEVSQQFRRRFGIVGADGVASLSPELVGVVVVDDLRDDVGAAAPTFPGIASGTQAGVANEFTVLTFGSLDPNMVVFVDRVIVQSGNGQNCFVSLEAGVLAGLTAIDERGYTDKRLPGSPSAQWFRDTDLNLRLTTTLINMRLRLESGIDKILDFKPAVIIMPGSSIAFEHQEIARPLNATAYFRERAIARGE